MSMEFVSISGGDGLGAIPERAFIVAKNADAIKLTYGMCVGWRYDIGADPYATTGTGYDVWAVDGSDTSRINHAGLNAGIVWPITGIPIGDWGRLLVYGEHPAALVYSAATAPFADFWEVAADQAGEMTTHVLRPWGNYLDTASRVGMMGAITMSGVETTTTFEGYPGGYAVALTVEVIATAGSTRVFCKFLG